MGGTRGSGVLSSTGDVLEMSVVRGVGEVCDICMCLAGGCKWIRGMGLGFTNPVGTWEVFGRVSVFWLRWGVGRGLGRGEVVLWLGEG